MVIELQFNSVSIVPHQDMDEIVGRRLFVVPMPKSITPYRKSVKRGRRRKGCMKVRMLISDLIDGIRDG
jgi:hypothetical protein